MNEKKLNLVLMVICYMLLGYDDPLIMQFYDG